MNLFDRFNEILSRNPKKSAAPHLVIPLDPNRPAGTLKPEPKEK